MNQRPFALSIVLVPLATLVLGAGCANLEATFFKPKDSMVLLDELSGRIEQVHVASEVSKERMLAAVNTLRGIVSSDFRGNAPAAYAELTRAIEQSEEQADGLRECVDDMKDAAKTLFNRWAADLEGFTNAEMRMASQRRLEETRARYESIVNAVEPALWSYDAINRSLADHALFLGHDFNRASVSAISSGVESLVGQSKDLETRLASSMTAAHAYLDAAAPPGAVAAEPPK